MEVTIELVLKKSVVHKHVYASADEEAAIDTVYVRKDAFPNEEAPATAQLTFSA